MRQQQTHAHRSKQRLFDHFVSTGLQHRLSVLRVDADQSLAAHWRNVLRRRLHRRGPADLDRPGGYGLPEDIEATPSKRLFAAAEARTAKQDGEEDIMTHVLIIMSWLGAVNGAVISTQEFTSAERCEAARQALIEYAKARGLDETLRPLCMQK
jgi:hypothetical protein